MHQPSIYVRSNNSEQSSERDEGCNSLGQVDFRLLGEDLTLWNQRGSSSRQCDDLEEIPKDQSGL